MRRAQRMLLERAKQRYEGGRGAGEDARSSLEGALDALDLAYRLHPAPWLLFNTAQVQSRLGACSEAADLYRRFLASDPAPEVRASAEQALGLLASCQDSSGEPHMDVALAPGLRVPQGLDSMFVPVSIIDAPATQASSGAEPTDDANVAAILPWTFGSLSLISGVAGAIFWSEAHAAKRDLDHIRVAGPRVAQTQERGESAQNFARIFGGCAVGFGVAAAVSYWLQRPGASEEPVALSWVPLEGGGGAVYRSSF
jgi:hypothetical protein